MKIKTIEVRIEPHPDSETGVAVTLKRLDDKRWVAEDATDVPKGNRGLFYSEMKLAVALNELIAQFNGGQLK
jgi:hypothetical protein